MQGKNVPYRLLEMSDTRKDKFDNLGAFFPSAALFERSSIRASADPSAGAEFGAFEGGVTVTVLTLAALDLSLEPCAELLTLKFRHLSCVYKHE